MKRGLFLGALLSHAMLFSQNLVVESLDKEEAFLVKRITEFWKDQDYNLVEKQIQQFLIRYPNSELKDYLKGILGDIYLKNQSYDKAIEVYTSITKKEIQEKVLLNTLQALYETNQYVKLCAIGEGYLNSADKFSDRKDELYFLLAEGYFRSADKAEENYVQNLQKAKGLFEKLEKTNYNDPSLFALAEIYKELSEPSKSAEIYKRLSERYKDKKEELLFQAGVAESLFNPKLAIETFSDVMQLEGDNQFKSAFNRIVLLFQLQAYDSVIESIDFVLQNSNEQTLDQVMYMYSRALFGVKMYDKALQIVSKIPSSEALDEGQKKNLYLIELGSLQQLKDLERYEQALKKFEIEFPQDKEIPKAIFIHALMLKEHLKTIEAQCELERIYTAFQDYENADALLLEYGLITHDNEQYELSQKSLKSFIETYPKSQQVSIAFKYYLSSALQLYDLVQKDAPTVQDYSKIQLFQDLEWVLKNQVGLNDKELQQTRFLDAQIGFDLGYVQESLDKLHTYIKDYANHPSVSDAHLMVALGYEALGSDFDKFIDHAEKAVLANQNPEKTSQIHLQIFNSLVQFKERLKQTKVSISASKAKMEKIDLVAAQHLYAAFSSSNTTIRKENLLWLSNYYYEPGVLETKIFERADKGQRVLSENLERCKLILQHVLFGHEGSSYFDLKADSSLDWEMMRLIKIVSYEGDLALKTSLLKTLVNAYEKADLTTPVRQQALVELGKCYEVMNQTQASLDCYEKASNLSLTQRTLSSEFAKIHAIRLQIEEIDAMSQDEIDEKISYLKGIQIEKSASSEPLHFEAALTYVEARKQMADPFNKDMMELFFLSRVQEDYDNTKDPAISAFRTNIVSNEATRKIFESYMKLIDLKMLISKSKLEANDGKMEESNIYRLEAMKVYRDLNRDKEITHFMQMSLNSLSEIFD